MPGSLARAAAAGLLLLALTACRREPPPRRSLSPALQPPASGSLVVEGLREPVTVVRDAAGIAHITAANEHDLFWAQGFVQAQDRLFQMDLWRRSVQGRLAEVLGANFIERDAMTRRVQYRGPMEPEWNSYGPHAKDIAAAFTDGVNAWIAQVQRQVPAAFALAGWKPEPWKGEDLLNRTDAFLASGDAQDEVLRARLVAAIGAPMLDAIWPPAPGERTTVPSGVDLGVVNYTLGDLLRRIGTAPFFSALWASVAGSPEADRAAGRPAAGSNAWAVAAWRTGDHGAFVSADPHRALSSPSLRYLVHLSAPGWNVIGATAPWLPGVAIGHNDAVAWAYAAAPVDVQDLFVERLNPANERQVQFQGRWVDVEVEHDAIQVKGRVEPFEYDRLYTRHGVIIGVDRERHLAYALRWSGTEPGTAGELASLTIDRATSLAELRDGLTRWKAPPADFVFGDRAGAVDRARVALEPLRPPNGGRVPSPGWNGAAEWRGWSRALRSGASQPRKGFVAAANDNFARTERLDAALSQLNRGTLAEMMALQQDVLAVTAERLVPLLARVDFAVDSGDVLRGARQDLMAWDRRMSAASSAAALYARWEEALRRLLVERRVPAALRSELTSRPWSIVPTLTDPKRPWFDADPITERDRLLADALSAAAQESAAPRPVSWGVEHQVLFTHPLAITDAARTRYNVGPFAVGGYADTVFATTAATGPALRIVMDAGDWDRSVAVNAPGQSESPASIHFKDMAFKWAAGGYVPLPFSAAAVQKNAAATLTLRPH